MLIKKQILRNKLTFSSKEVGTYFVKKISIVQSLPVLFIGAGAGAGEKNTQNRSKTDRLRNAEYYSSVIYIYNINLP